MVNMLEKEKSGRQQHVLQKGQVRRGLNSTHLGFGNEKVIGIMDQTRAGGAGNAETS